MTSISKLKKYPILLKQAIAYLGQLLSSENLQESSGKILTPGLKKISSETFAVS